MAGQVPRADEDRRKFFQELAGPNFQVTQSVYRHLNDAASGDPDKMTDELMTLLSDPMMEERRRDEERREADRRKREEAERLHREEVVRQEFARLEAAKKQSHDDEIRRQEEALREFAARKKQQDEEARKLAAERQRVEDEQKRLEQELQRRAQERQVRERALKEEEERRFAEDARRFDELRKAQADAANRLEAEKKLIDEAMRRKQLLEAEAARLDEERKLREAMELRLKQEQELRRQQLEAAAAKPAPAAAPVVRSGSAAAVTPPAAPASVPTAAPLSSDEAKKKEEGLQEMRAVYDRKLQELEARLAAFDQKMGGKPDSGKAGSEVVPQGPAVCILVDNDTPQEKADEVVAFLQSKQVKPSDVRVVNASSDFELVQVVKGQRTELKYPSIIIRNTSLGTLDDLKAVCVKIGVLEQLLAGEKVDLSYAFSPEKKSGPQPPELQLGLYDYGISATEFTLRTVGTIVFLPIIAPYKLFSWAFGGKQQEVAKGEDIDVIQSNWYWRHQLRTIRFLDDQMLRMRPGYEDVRAVHKYDEVKEVRLLDSTNLVIGYRAGGADYLRTTPADVQRIVQILTAKNKLVQVIRP
jgi:hypothetical protein